jgi:serine/threonine protein kinase
MTSSRGLVPEMPNSSPSAAQSSGGDEKARARARVGMTINAKWRLDALLGVGGMASVYAATHRNGSRAALKILHTEFARDPGIRDRFLREGYVANRIDHPGRVAIQDDDVTEQDEPFLVMELLEGETVQQLWKRKNRKVPPVEALGIAADILETLTGFHAEGIVHRDLKPANIFVTREGVVKLLDFGVARMREAGGDKTRAGTALGTPSFMAPEQAMGLADGVDGRADLFSVGATLFALMSGQRLHQGRSDNEAFILAATTPAPSLARVAADLPVEVIALVDKALAWDKRARFADAAEMRDEALRVIHLLGGEMPGERGARGAPARRGPEVDVGAPIVEELRDGADEADLDPNDPAVQRLVDVFRRLERLIPAVRHYGWAHPEADGKLRATFQGIIESLRADPQAFHWKLTPYAFTHRGPIVWEPTAPLDSVPYNLFAAGIRRVHLLPGFTEDELRALVAVMMLDPSHDLAPEDDVAAALWERRLDHVRYDAINVFAEGDAADREAFWNEADDVEAIARRSTEEKANRVEAMAMAIATDGGALVAARSAAAALALDPVAKRALGAQLAISPERWSERYIDVLADAVLDARKRKDLDLVLEPLDASTRELILERKFELVFQMWDSLSKALEAYAPKQSAAAVKADVAAGMFSPETVKLLIREAVRATPPGQPELSRVDLDRLTADFSPVLSGFGPTHLGVVLDLVPIVTHEPLRQALVAYVERSIVGREAEVVDRLVRLDLATARPILQGLAQSRRPGAVDALRRVAATGGPGHRCEATALLAHTPEQLRDDLLALTENQDPGVRAAALRALAQHQVRAAGPLLVRRVQDPSFHQLPVDERREILRALFALHLARAESLSVEILNKHSLLGTDDATEQTRAICAELLGANSNSSEALEAVLGGLKRRWWNSQLLRDAATIAADAIAARLGKRISPAGELVS